MNLSKNSWHNRLFKAGCHGIIEHWMCDVRSNQSNICTYITRMIMGTFVIAVETITLAILSICFMDGIVTSFLYMFTNGTGYFIIELTFYIGFAIMIVIFLLLAIGAVYTSGLADRIGEYISARRSEIDNMPKKAPGLFAIWYKSFKEKTCIIINMVD